MAARLEAQFMHKWDMMLTDLHYAGALLSGLLGMDLNKVMNELTQYEEQ
jgi:hypothetical protein